MPSFLKQIIFTATLSLFFLNGSLFASQISSPPYPEKNNLASTGNKVHFSISESQKMDNDITTITFRATAQARSAQTVTHDINVKMQAALKTLKKYPSIIAKTSQYQIYPAYNKDQVIRHWNGSQILSITLDSDSEQLKALTELQKHLVYQNMQFLVSAKQQQKAMKQLSLNAIQSFQAQATLIANQFNAPHYQILETRINTPSPRFSKQNYAMSSRMVMAESMAAPGVEAGQSTLSVTISGILLLPF